MGIKMQMTKILKNIMTCTLKMMIKPFFNPEILKHLLLKDVDMI